MATRYFCDFCGEETKYISKTDAGVQIDYTTPVIDVAKTQTPADPRHGSRLRFRIQVLYDEHYCDEFYMPDICHACLNTQLAAYYLQEPTP